MTKISDWPMMRTAMVLLCNLLIMAGILRSAGHMTPWAPYLALHALSAALILVRPAGKMQAVIGIGYVIACTSDVAYGLGDIRAFSHYAQASYLDKQWWLAVIQIAVLGGWAIAGFRKHRGALGPRARLALPRASHHQGVE